MGQKDLPKFEKEKKAVIWIVFIQDNNQKSK